MTEPQTEKKTSVTTVIIRIAIAVLIPLFTVWYVDREARIKDLKETIVELRESGKYKDIQLKEKDGEIKHWIGKYIQCERQVPSIIDTLKARIKNNKDE